MVFESSTGLLQIFDRFPQMAGWNLAASVSTLALVLMVYFRDGNLTGILVAYMLGKSINALGLTLAALVEASRRWGKSWWKTPVSLLNNQRRELTHFAISTNISASLSLITKDSEVLWVSFFRGPVEAGYYRLALSLANIVQLPVSPLPQATYPELSRQVARLRWDNFRYIMRQGSYLAGGYSLAATLFLIALGSPLIATIYSPEYLPAYPALIILLVGLLIANTFYWRRPALLALGHPDFPTKVNSILAAAKVIGIILLVPTYGYLASAVLLAGFYWIGSIVNVLKIRSVITQRAQVSGT
jgi:O-antigen/teichoic acid export membrane protein